MVGTVQVDLRGTPGEFVSSWFNPITGEMRKGTGVAGGDVRNFESPWPEAVLHVSAPLTVRAARDGDWPRVPSAIVRDGPAEFTVYPMGHDRYVSVEVENASTRARPIALRGFITDFGRTRDRKVSPDQYLYVKPPNASWRRVYRDGDTLRLTALPGRTRVATVATFQNEDYERFVESLNDPRVRKDSSVEKMMLAFWPYWFEFGIDNYDHENKWGAVNAKPENFGGALVTHLEIPFYGKDDIDPTERLREQGRMWARSHSQAFLAMQRDREYWTDVPVDKAVFLPLPQVSLVGATSRPLTLYHEHYEQGIGTRRRAVYVSSTRLRQYISRPGRRRRCRNFARGGNVYRNR